MSSGEHESQEAPPTETVEEEENSLAPYPGLRPFQTEELSLFFGRDEIRDEMVEIFERKHFLAVLGASGSGKSSLVRTAFFSALFAGQAQQAGTQWIVADIAHPAKTNPFKELAKALLAARKKELGIEASPTEAEQLAQFLRSPGAIRAWYEREGFAPGKKLIILVDQFEELFRFQRFETAGEDFDKDHADSFVSRLLECVEDLDDEGANTSPIYMVMTMRAEFLSVCTTLSGSDLTDNISRNNVIPQRMSEEDCRKAIKGPEGVLRNVFPEHRFEIHDDVVEEIINDMERLAPWEREESDSDQVERLARRADQLPLMQHVLRYLWRQAKRRGREQSEVPTIALTDYRGAGGIQGAINKHANEIMAKWPGEDRAWNDEERKCAELIFRALVDGPSVDKAVRRQLTIKEIVDETDQDESLVAAIVNIYRHPNHAFLAPFGTDELEPDAKVDISHESLIRQWESYRKWIKQEATSGQAWQQLLATSKPGKDGTSPELLGGVNLIDANRWWVEQQPHLGWAKRYNEPANDDEAHQEQFDRAEGYLRLSQKRKERRKKLLYGTSGSLAVIAGALAYLSTYLTGEIEALASDREKAEVYTNRALTQAELAERQRVAALAERSEAIELRKSAERQAEQAESRMALAERRARAANADALRAERRANSAIQVANRKTVEALAQTKLAAAELAPVIAETIAEAERGSSEDAAQSLNSVRQRLALIGEWDASQKEVILPSFWGASLRIAEKNYDVEQLETLTSDPIYKGIDSGLAASFMHYQRGRAALLRRDFDEATSRFSSVLGSARTVPSEDLSARFAANAYFWNGFSLIASGPVTKEGLPALIEASNGCNTSLNLLREGQRTAEFAQCAILGDIVSYYSSPDGGISFSSYEEASVGDNRPESVAEEAIEASFALTADAGYRRALNTRYRMLDEFSRWAESSIQDPLISERRTVASRIWRNERTDSPYGRIIDASYTIDTSDARFRSMVKRIADGDYESDRARDNDLRYLETRLSAPIEPTKNLVSRFLSDRNGRHYKTALVRMLDRYEALSAAWREGKRRSSAFDAFDQFEIGETRRQLAIASNRYQLELGDNSANAEAARRDLEAVLLGINYGSKSKPSGPIDQQTTLDEEARESAELLCETDPAHNEDVDSCEGDEYLSEPYRRLFSDWERTRSSVEEEQSKFMNYDDDRLALSGRDITSCDGESYRTDTSERCILQFGSMSFPYKHDGLIWLFRDAKSRKRFIDDKDDYIPVFDGFFANDIARGTSGLSEALQRNCTDELTRMIARASGRQIYAFSIDGKNGQPTQVIYSFRTNEFDGKTPAEISTIVQQLIDKWKTEYRPMIKPCPVEPVQQAE